MQHTFQAIDKRQTMRFDVNANNIPITLEQNNQITSVLDISRGGIAVTHNNTLNVGDVVPVHITYGDIDVNADVKIVSATKERAGAEFVNLDEATANNILYMNIMIEDTIANGGTKTNKTNKQVKRQERNVFPTGNITDAAPNVRHIVSFTTEE